MLLQKEGSQAELGQKQARNLETLHLSYYL